MAQPYRLEALITLRKREEDEAQEALVAAEDALCAANDRVTAAALELGRREAALREARDEMGIAKPRRAAEHETLRRFAERRRHELESAEAELGERRTDAARRTAERDCALAMLRERIQERDAVERHRERWQAEQRKEADRREEMILDDLAVGRGAKGDG